jgi:hypothetical protein
MAGSRTIRSASGRGARQVLAVESGDRMFRAALCQAGAGGVVEVVQECSSPASELAGALDDILAQMRQTDRRRGLDAVVLSPHVQSAVLQLPVNPRRPLPAQEMRRLVKWELEPYLSQDQDFAGEPACGWAAVDAPPADGKWQWNAAAAAESFRRHVAEVLASRNIRLCGLYSMDGQDGPRSAAAAAMGLAGPAAAACVPATEPSDPLLKDRRVWACLGAAAVTAALLAGALQFGARRAEGERILRDFRAISNERARVESQRRRLSELDKAVNFARTTLPRRQKLVPELLSALETSCPPGVTIDKFTEDTGGHVVLGGWAVSPQEAQAFKINLQALLKDMRVDDGTEPIRRRSATSSAGGYTFEFRLVSDMAAVAAGGRR